MWTSRRLSASTVVEIGYDRAKYGFDCDTCAVLTAIDEQSPDIAMGVDSALESRDGTDADLRPIGAGDQGMMFGYACRRNPGADAAAHLPGPQAVPSSLPERAQGRHAPLSASGRQERRLPSSMTMTQPVRIDAVVVSTQHAPGVSLDTDPRGCDRAGDQAGHSVRICWTRTPSIYVNPTGRFVIGGPQGDSGLTGRKIIVDTYGGYRAATAAARSPARTRPRWTARAAYAARYVAKNIVAAGLGEARARSSWPTPSAWREPVSVMVDTFGTGVVGDDVLEKAVEKVFDLRPAAIIEQLDLRKPIYKQLAAYGHMGREELGVKWENTDKVEALKAAVNG